MHILGFLGMPRRIYTYSSGLNWDQLNLISTIGSYILGIGFAVFIINILYSRKYGERATENPWNAGTLEWYTTSPPAGYNFAPIPRVNDRNPLWDKNFGVQPAETGLSVTQREVLSTSIVDAKIQGVIPIPHPTPWPFLLALVCGIGFVGVIFSLWWFVIGFFLAALAMTGWFWPKNPWRNYGGNDDSH